MEEENKISFWKKIKISIFGLEDYQRLAAQRIGKTIGYLAKLMAIFVLLLSIVVTCKFAYTVQNIINYMDTELSQINFENNSLSIKKTENSEEPIIIENQNFFNGKIIIDTNELSEEQINSYTDQVKGYTNGVVVLKDKIIFKTGVTTVLNTVSLSDLSNEYNIVKLDKQELLNTLSGSNIWIIYSIFFIAMYIYLFIIYFSTVLIDAILYSLLGYFTGILSRLRLKYSATYNIAVYSLTLPIILNLIYIIVNMLTGYTIKYFDIMYMAITCIYIITAILMIKSDIIKKQIELSKIISEQEKIKAEMQMQEEERKQEEERERIRKEDEKKRQEEKKKQTKKKKEGPEPQANIKEKMANE